MRSFLGRTRPEGIISLGPGDYTYHRPRKQNLKMGAAFLLAVGSFLLTVELFYLHLTSLAFLLTIGAFLLTVLAFLLTAVVFLAYNGKLCLIRALRGL